MVTDTEQVPEADIGSLSLEMLLPLSLLLFNFKWEQQEMM